MMFNGLVIPGFLPGSAITINTNNAYANGCGNRIKKEEQYVLLLFFYYTDAYASSSSIASLFEAIRRSYSSCEPTIILSYALSPVPAGIR